jgi:predicted RNase H-like HicB family nuclease
MEKEKMSELAKYLGLPYTVTLRQDGDGDFVGRVEELPGCAAHGKTAQEALENLDEAKSLWIQDCLENGDPVPPPEEESALPSGKWLQRVPRKLHRKLQTLSKKEGVSLNQYVTALLAEAVGERTATQKEHILPHAYDVFADCALGYFMAQDFVEPVPSPWHVINVTPSLKTSASGQYISALAHLSAQLPNKSVLKGKKDAKEKHTNF